MATEKRPEMAESESRGTMPENPQAGLEAETQYRRVLVVTTSRRTRGGIAAVVRGLEQDELWKKHACRWIETQIDRGMVLKAAYLVKSYALFFRWAGKYDIVHFHTVPGNSTRIHLPMLRWAKRRGCKILVHLHIGEQLVAYAGDQKFNSLLGEADRILVLSNKARELLKAHYHLSTPVEVLYNACAVEPVERAGLHDNAGTEIEETEHGRTNLILVAGILDANKAYDVIIDAFAQLAERYPDWRLVFAGNGELEKAEALVRRSGIANRVEFRGWVSGAEKEELFRQAKVYCMASYKEGFPMSVLEAWACGIPVVCTPAGGLADVVVDGENALVLEPGNSSDLARQLERMMSDEVLRKNLRNAALRMVEEKFSPKQIGAQLEKIYREL